MLKSRLKHQKRLLDYHPFKMKKSNSLKKILKFLNKEKMLNFMQPLLSSCIHLDYSRANLLQNFFFSCTLNAQIVVKY